MGTAAQRSRTLDVAVGAGRDNLVTPALVIDLDAVEHNIRSIVEFVGGADRWRPHVKTIKQSRLIGSFLDAGVTAFKCATVDEFALIAETAAARRVAPDILLAYPASPPMLRQLANIVARHAELTVSLLADSPEHLGQVVEHSGVMGMHGAGVLLDVDLGMGRTGSAPSVWQAALDRGLPSSTRPRVIGLHGYDGHLQWEHRDAAFAGYDALCQLGRQLPDPRLVVTSGSHSFAHALAHDELGSSGPWQHQVGMGTVVLCDVRSEAPAQAVDLRQAAFVASRVVSAPRSDRITLDAGTKAIAPDRPPPNCSVLGWPGLHPLQPSEEHLPVAIGHGAPPARDTIVWLIPDHVCTTVNLYREVVYIRGDRPAGVGQVEAMGRPVWRTDAP